MAEDMLKIKGRAMAHYLKPYLSDIKITKKDGTSGFNKRQNKV
jgi:hypothetical protein